MRIIILIIVPFLTFSDISEREDVKQFIFDTAKNTVLSEEEVKNYLSNAVILQRVIRSRDNQPETKFSWNRYRKIFLKQQRIKDGADFLVKYSDLFDKIENDYGVSKFYIASIIGAETNFGKNLGSLNPLDAISTLAFESNSKFWQKELVQLLLLSKEYQLSPKDMKSSWAGALGLGQFIPSSYLAYGVDYDQDGKVDMTNSLEDGIASVANYLKVHGWKSGKIPVESFEINEKFLDFNEDQINSYNFPYKVNNFRTRINSEEMKRMELTNSNFEGKATPLFVIEGNETMLYLGFDNFIVITKYNRSSYYALVIHQLAVAISKEFYERN
jgi:membrane-bound lytic murein transglycosylase B